MHQSQRQYLRVVLVQLVLNCQPYRCAPPVVLNLRLQNRLVEPVDLQPDQNVPPGHVIA